jgi:hypothetical protein
MLQPFARAFIDGPTPLHVFNKPRQGTGATLLAQVICYPALGRSVSVMTQGRDEDEWRKRITATLKDSPAAVVLDNLNGEIQSPALSAALTAPVFSDRLLGYTKTIHLPVRCLWVATANNVSFGSDLPRRCVAINLDARMVRPWEREEASYRHPDIIGWADENRADLVWAALVLIKNWLVSGQPAWSGRPLGSYESWSRVMGGILETAGVNGFLGNAHEFYENSDTERSGQQWLIERWWYTRGVAIVNAGVLFDAFMLTDSSPELHVGGGNDRSQRTSFGMQIGKLRGQVFQIPDGPELVVTPIGRRKPQAWRLVPREGPQT